MKQFVKAMFMLLAGAVFAAPDLGVMLPRRPSDGYGDVRHASRFGAEVNGTRAGHSSRNCAGAMPTKEALEAARPRVAEMSAGIVDKLNSGELKPGGGAEALVALAEKETGEAEKFLLLNGALRLHMRGGDIAGAKVVVDKLRTDIKGLTAEQLNDMMLEESNNFIATLLNENVSKAPEKNGPKWHVRKSRLERSGLTVTSLDELRKCDRSKVERKGEYQIYFQARRRQTIHYFTLSVFDNGSCDIRVTTPGKTPMHYTGELYFEPVKP